MGLSKRKKKNSPVAAVCSALGTVLLIILVVLCVPLTLPRLAGFHIYTVVSGSMEPAIPLGSLLYIQKAAPEDMAEGDVIAYYGGAEGAAIITHRVVENRVVMGEFVTKGDANKTEDRNPVPYSNFIGVVRIAIPRAGSIAEAFTSFYGKIAAAGLVAFSVILKLIASVMETRGGENH